MSINIDQFDSAGVALAYWARNNTSGYPLGPTGSIANGSDASMSRLVGIQSIGVTLQQPRQVNIGGDDGAIAVYFFESEALPSGNMVLGAFDATLTSQAQNTKTYADGDWDVPLLQPSGAVYNSITLLTISQAKSAASGSFGNPGFMGKFYPRVQIVPLGDAGLTNATGTTFTHALIANKFSVLPWGTSLSIANNGATEAAVYGPFYSEGRPLLHTHVGDAADTTLTLAQTPSAANGNKVKAWKNGVALVYTTDYSVSGTTFTFVSAPAAGAITVIRYEF